MTRLIGVILVALSLASGAPAQTDQQHDMPGMQMTRPYACQNQQSTRVASGMQTSGETKPTVEAQEQTMPDRQHGMEDMEMHSPGDITSNVSGVQEPENPQQRTGSNLPVPDLLKAARAIPAGTLDDFEALAQKNNPTLKQADAIVRTSAGLARQAGLWPNPSTGYQGEEIRGGAFRGGEQGAFVQQTIVLGSKLRLRRNVFEQQRKADEIGVEEQELNVRGAVQQQFYSALAQLRIVEVQREMLAIASDAATTAHQLANVGQADAPDVLQAEVELEQTKLEYVEAQRGYIQSYGQLAALAGNPQMPLALLKGNLEGVPVIDAERYLQDLVVNSPGLKRAQQEAAVAAATLARDKREAVPDLTLRAGVQQNREINDLSLSPVGAQGFATASVQIPIFNRNQGNVQASQAQLERERQEVERMKLRLVQTAEPLLQQYLTSRLAAERYKTQLIPRARRAYELYLQKYRSMAAAYPEVLISQRTFVQLQDGYARTLGKLWTTAVELQNYLLVDGLRAPQPAGSTSTQINLPTSGPGGAE